MPFVSVPLLEQAKAGGCDQRYVLMISLLRAMGIPAMMDYAPSITIPLKIIRG
ncbi:MAG: transglutaminase-like domain-containing protein [Bacteroides sp.]|nr:transglutaminase-like domain-containing protein [Bacteroides sp.]